MDRDAPAARILVLADDALARAGLVAVLSDTAGLGPIGSADLGPDGAAALAYYRPELVLADLGWEPERALERLAALEPAASLLLLAPDPASAPAAWALAPRAVLNRAAPAERLASALAAVLAGLWVADPAYAPLTPPAPAPLAGPDDPLTPRELEVLALLAEGLPNKAIAHRLGISEHTVKFHVNALLAKLGAASRTEAAIRAARLGLVSM